MVMLEAVHIKGRTSLVKIVRWDVWGALSRSGDDVAQLSLHLGVDLHDS
jgi:hypothetical protein